MIMNWN